MIKRICGLALACGLLAACSGTGQQSVVPQTTTLTDPQLASPPAAATDSANAGSAISTMSTTTSPAISHITVVLMENYDYSQIIGNASAPYINSFAKANALFTNSHGVTHPSEPNYLALFSGSTQGVTTDACPTSFSAPNLATELAAKGYSFAGYAENWPASSACTAAPSTSVSSGYLYWRKHVPWEDFTNISANSVGHLYSGPGTALTGSVNFIVPNQYDDMHDTTPAAGDAWLSKNIPAILSYDNTHNGLLIVTFDEGEYSGSNQVVTIAAGPMVRNGTYTQSINHYSILRLIENNFGLPLLGQSANVTPISGLLNTSTGTGTTATPAPLPSPSSSYSFVKTGTVKEVYSSSHYLMYFPNTCGYLNVYTTSGTTYSPTTWRPAVGNPVTVSGSGSCSTSATAAKVTYN